MKFFIVEDDLLNKIVLKEYIKTLGYYLVGEASSYEEAIQKLKDCKIDILITDIILYDKNGIELIKKYRRTHKDEKIIAMTIIDEKEADKKIREAGAGYILKKPFTIEELKKAIDEV